MADDANFCGGRLRLAAFLRVVENDMPQRPSRFKRRVPLVEEMPRELNHNLVGIADFSVATNDYDNPRLSTPTDSNLNSDDPDAGTNKGRPTTKPTKQARQKSGVAHTSRAKGSSSKSHKPSSTRKRWLPVNSLALLRTTTSDGLPEPSVRGV